jgi:dihydrofolate synthase/folylpolyglutamate synthase
MIKREPLTIVDVGHTPDGIRQSLASLQGIYGRAGWVLVLGVSFDKKASDIVGALAPSFDTIICAAAHHKGMDAETIAAAVRQANPDADVHVTASIEDAVDASQKLASSQNRKIYVAGGLFLAVEYAVVAKGERAEDLKFF